MKPSVAIVGASGRMGRELLKQLIEHNEFNPLFGISNHPKKIDERFKVRCRLEDVELAEVDLIIDFSTPRASLKALAIATKFKKPFLTGTTGFSGSQISKLKLAGKIAPVFWAPNMSLGIACLKQMMKTLARLNDSFVQIDEVHHQWKKDSPSGTAKALFEVLTQDRKNHRLLPRPRSIRTSNVVGIHKVEAFRENEIIRIEHLAFSRGIFADGAIKAGRWLCRQKKGYYTMDDFLDSNLKP